MSKRSQSSQFYLHIAQRTIAALTAQTKLAVTLAAYGIVALLLLVYVSAQVYSSVLSQDIVEVKRTSLRETERLNRLTSEYVALSSRARVAKYCEEKLGMVPAAEATLQRIAVQSEVQKSLRPGNTLTKRTSNVGSYGLTLTRELSQSD